MKIPAKYKEAIKEKLSRARGVGMKLAKGSKGTIYSGATGAGCFYIGRELHDRFEIFQKNEYALPLAFVVAGHIVKKKQVDIGAAMVGVGGFTAAQVYQAKADAKKSGATPSVNAPPGTPSAADIAKKLAEGGAYVPGALGAGWSALDAPMLRGAAGYVGNREAAGVIEPARREAGSFYGLSDI